MNARCTASLFCLLAASVSRADIIISQYYAGAIGADKWIELYNAGTTDVDLAADSFQLGLWLNNNREAWKAGTAPIRTMSLSGTIPAGNTYLLSYNTSSAPSYAQPANATSTTVINFNGDDTIALYKQPTYAFANVVDAFGNTSTTTAPFANRSFVRNAGVTTGVNTDFNAADWTEYTLAEVDNALPGTTERIGFHATAAAAPEPATAGLLVLGLLTVRRFRRR
ncbi:MAG: lamin tail domain-containing protein [Kiritimatiellia bacterium]